MEEPHDCEPLQQTPSGGTIPLSPPRSATPAKAQTVVDVPFDANTGEDTATSSTGQSEVLVEGASLRDSLRSPPRVILPPSKSAVVHVVDGRLSIASSSSTPPLFSSSETMASPSSSTGSADFDSSNSPPGSVDRRRTTVRATMSRQTIRDGQSLGRSFVMIKSKVSIRGSLNPTAASSTTATVVPVLDPSDARATLRRAVQQEDGEDERTLAVEEGEVNKVVSFRSDGAASPGAAGGSQSSGRLTNPPPLLSQLTSRILSVTRNNSSTPDFAYISVSERVDSVLSSSPDLQAFTNGGTQHAWFREMIVSILLNRVSRAPASGPVARDDYRTLTAREGAALGASLTRVMMYHAGPGTAVDEWIWAHPALLELDAECGWFRPCLMSIAGGLMSSSNAGLSRVVFVGVLGVVDRATDAYAAYMFSQQGRYAFVAATMSTVLICFLANACFVRLQYAKKGWRKQLTMSLLVLIGLKGAFDTARLNAGVEADHELVTTIGFEIMATRVIDVFAESIPNCVVQTYAFVASARTSYVPLISIFVSAATAAFNTATISYESDIEPSSRKQNPRFYGFVPNNAQGRTAVFSFIFFFSFFHCILRALSTALLVAASPIYFLLYILADFGLFIFVKVIRGDFWYWFPTKTLWGRLVNTIALRFIVKIVCDMTALVLLRHPFELGGLYYSLSLFSSQAMSFIASFIYLATQKSHPIPSTPMWIALSAMLTLSMMTYGLFLYNIERSYLATFFDTRTGPQMLHDIFRLGNDEMKAAVLQHHPSYYQKFRPQLKQWVMANWEKWVVEKPVFFSTRFLTYVPKDMIPENLPGYRGSAYEIKHVVRPVTEGREAQTRRR